MATRSVSIDERLYLKIKAAARKNKRTIRAQAEYWIRIGMMVDRQLQKVGWEEFFESALELAELKPLIRSSPSPDVELLVTELERFAANPSKDGAVICRAIIDDLQPLGTRDKRINEFLERAHQTVARPYRNASREIAELVRWFQAKLL